MTHLVQYKILYHKKGHSVNRGLIFHTCYTFMNDCPMSDRLSTVLGLSVVS